MKSSPLSVIGDALATSVGWAGFIFLTAAVAAWFGLWIGHLALPAPSSAIVPLGGAFITGMFYPPATFCCVVIFLAYYLPVHYECYWRTAAIINAITWLLYTIATTGFMY
jgi:hypothetical protein